MTLFACALSAGAALWNLARGNYTIALIFIMFPATIIVARL